MDDISLSVIQMRRILVPTCSPSIADLSLLLCDNNLTPFAHARGMFRQKRIQKTGMQTRIAKRSEEKSRQERFDVAIRHRGTLTSTRHDKPERFDSLRRLPRPLNTMPLLLFFTVLLNGPHYHRIISRYLFTPDGCVYRMEELPNRGGLVSSLICLEHRLKILGKLGYPRKLIVFFFFLKNTLETGAYVFPSTVKILITREDNLLNFRVIGGKQFLKRSFQKWNNIIYGTITFGDTIIGSFRKLFTR